MSFQDQLNQRSFSVFGLHRQFQPHTCSSARCLLLLVVMRLLLSTMVLLRLLMAAAPLASEHTGIGIGRDATLAAGMKHCLARNALHVWQDPEAPGAFWGAGRESIGDRPHDQ